MNFFSFKVAAAAGLLAVVGSLRSGPGFVVEDINVGLQFSAAVFQAVVAGDRMLLSVATSVGGSLWTTDGRDAVKSRTTPPLLQRIHVCGDLTLDVASGDLTLDVASGDLTLDVASGDLTPS